MASKKLKVGALAAVPTEQAAPAPTPTQVGTIVVPPEPNGLVGTPNPPAAQPKPPKPPKVLNAQCTAVIVKKGQAVQCGQRARTGFTVCVDHQPAYGRLTATERARFDAWIGQQTAETIADELGWHRAREIAVPDAKQEAEAAA